MRVIYFIIIFYLYFINNTTIFRQRFESSEKCVFCVFSPIQWWIHTHSYIYGWTRVSTWYRWCRYSLMLGSLRKWDAREGETYLGIFFIFKYIIIGFFLSYKSDRMTRARNFCWRSCSLSPLPTPTQVSMFW